MVLHQKIVYLAGSFDLLHIGHINIMRNARKLGTHLTVAVLTDNAVAAYKRTPIIPFYQRFALIEALALPDEVIPQKDTDPTKYGELQAVDPDILVHGNDWDTVPGQEWMEERGKEVVFLSYTPEISTSLIIEKILKNYQEIA